jgi:hypothetical protein
MLAITAAGVDRVLDDGMSHPARAARLEPGHDDPSMNGQD